MHLSQAQRILNSGQPVDISVWKADGSVMSLRSAVSLRYDFYGGFRNMKVVGSGGIRRIRDCCIFMLNGEEVEL